MFGVAIATVAILQAQVAPGLTGPGGTGGSGGGVPHIGAQNIVGYLPYYRMSSIDLSKLAMCTDVAYFSGEFTVNADLVLPQNRRDHLTLLTQLKQTMGFRLFLTIIGDFGPDGFEEAVSTEFGREKMATQLANICIEYDLDGIDFDWEFPDTWTEVDYYTDLLWRTKTKLSSIRGMVTAAVAPGQLMDAAFFEPLNRVHMMAYLTDFPTCQTYAQWVLNKGCPPLKLTIGVPFYGRDQVTGTAYKYSTLVNTYPVIHQNPFLDWVGDIFFNGRQTQFVKTRWATTSGFRGMAIWELGQDINGDTSLLKTIFEASKGN